MSTFTLVMSGLPAGLIPLSIVLANRSKKPDNTTRHRHYPLHGGAWTSSSGAAADTENLYPTLAHVVVIFVQHLGPAEQRFRLNLAGRTEHLHRVGLAL